MFSRWTQENFFKYMIYHYDIDKLMEYGTTPVSGLERIINPVWKKLDSTVRSLNSKITSNNAKFAKIELNREVDPKHLEHLIEAKAEIIEEIQNLNKDLEEAKAKRKEVKKHITFEELPEKDKFEKLKPSGKMFTDTIKLPAYRAETAMANIMKEFLGRKDDARPIIRTIMTSEADLIPDMNLKILTVQLHRMNSAHIDKAVKLFLDELNKTETLFPGTDIKIRYKLAE